LPLLPLSTKDKYPHFRYTEKDMGFFFRHARRKRSRVDRLITGIIIGGAIGSIIGKKLLEKQEEEEKEEKDENPEDDNKE
jgi:hypothetical protein